MPRKLTTATVIKRLADLVATSQQLRDESCHRALDVHEQMRAIRQQCPHEHTTARPPIMTSSRKPELQCDICDMYLDMGDSPHWLLDALLEDITPDAVRLALDVWEKITK